MASGAVDESGSEEQPWLAHFRGDVAFFNDMVDLIPSKYYIRDEEAEAQHWNKYWRNKKNHAPKQAIKENTKQAKKAKFDLSAGHLTTQKQEEARKEAQKEGSGAAVPPSKPSKKPVRGGSINDLRARLHARIEELRKKRNADSQDAGDTKQRDGATKRRRREKRDASLAKSGRSTFTKQTSAAGAGSGKGESAKAHGASSVPLAIDYGVVQFGAPGAERKKKGKSLQQLFARAKATEARFKELSTADAAQAKLEKAWDAAEKRLAGKKVKDDPKLLAKALKRREQKKKKSQKLWAARVATVEKAKKQRVNRRNENLANRGAKKQRPGFEGKRKKFLNE